MRYILLLAILVSVYIGNVLGCIVLCETIPELRRAKRFMWQVPLVNISYVAYVLFSSSKKGSRFQSLLQYLKTPCKNVIAIYATVDAVEESASEKKKRSRQQPGTHMARLIFTSFKGICAATWSFTL